MAISMTLASGEQYILDDSGEITGKIYTCVYCQGKGAGGICSNGDGAPCYACSATGPISEYPAKGRFYVIGVKTRSNSKRAIPLYLALDHGYPIGRGWLHMVDASDTPVNTDKRAVSIRRIDDL